MTRGDRNSSRYGIFQSAMLRLFSLACRRRDVARRFVLAAMNPDTATGITRPIWDFTSRACI